MKKFFYTMAAFAFCFCVSGSARLLAEGEVASTNTVAVTEPVSVSQTQEELKADKEKIQAERQEMKEHGMEARSEEKAIHQQIKDAQAAGDTAKVKELRDQLKSTHQANVQQRKADVKQLKGAKKEMRADKKTAWKNRADRNKDGSVDAVEKKKAKKRGWFGR